MRFLGQATGATISDERQKAAGAAGELLRDVAKGFFKVIPPDTAAPVQAASPAPAIAKRERDFTRSHLDGI